MFGDGNRGPHSPWPSKLWCWVTLDRLCGVALIAFVVLAFALFGVAFVNHEKMLDWTYATSLRYLEPPSIPSAVDRANLEAGAKAFEAERSKLLSADAINFLIVLMSVIVVTVAIKIFSGSEKKLKRAEKKLDQARQISRCLASFVGATSVGQLASILAGMVNSNLDRLAGEFAVSMTPGQEDAVVGVMRDWLRSLRNALVDPGFVQIGIPRATLDALREAIAPIDDQFRDIDLALKKDLDETRTKIVDLVRDWLIFSNASEPHDLEEGTRRLREITNLVQKLHTEGCACENELALKIKPRLLQHELNNQSALMSSIDKFSELDTHLHRVQTRQTQLQRLQQTVDECRRALRDDLCQHWDEFNEHLNNAQGIANLR